MSEPIPAVYSAIAKVMGAIGKDGIAKDRKNEQQHYKFRGIDDVYNALNGYLADAGLVVLPRVMSSEREERTAKHGGALIYSRLTMEFDFVAASDGSRHVVRTIGEAMDSADKSSNKAMSAAYKYACMQAFCIPTEGDNDADATTHVVEPKAAPAPAAPVASTSPAGSVFDRLKAKIWTFGTIRELEAWRSRPDVEAAVNSLRAAEMLAFSKQVASFREHIEKHELEADAAAIRGEPVLMKG